jgi:aminoglycoside/choline kinase family phosphotransferase
MRVERESAKKAFLDRSGWGTAVQSPLPSDASTRRYVRLRMNGRGAMLMDQPQNAEAPPSPADATPDERRRLGYNAVARLAGADCGRFVAASNYLRALGLSAPDIYACDCDAGFAIIEDLGDDLYTDVIAGGGDERLLCETAADVLAQLHARPAPSLLPPDKPLHPYDETAMVAETDLLVEWFIPVALDRAPTPAEIGEHRALWRAALAPILGAPRVFVHRDYHAQNLMWLPQRSGRARVGLIDFQDAVAGPYVYDLISLIEDARRDVSPAVAAATTKRYLETMRNQGTPVYEEEFRTHMAVMAAQRNAKIAGIFARLYRRDGKPRYLDFLPRVWTYLNRDLEHPSLSAVNQWYDRHIPAEARGMLRIPAVS